MGWLRVRKVHRLGVDWERAQWRVQVPAGMRWAVDHAPTVTVGAQVDIGTAVPIDRLILKAQGGCEIQAGVLRATAAGKCIITWRAPYGQVTTSTRWTHVGPRGSRVEAGMLTRGFVVRDGAETKVTFHNRYRTQDQVVTRTVYVTPQCPTTSPNLGPRHLPPGLGLSQGEMNQWQASVSGNW